MGVELKTRFDLGEHLHLPEAGHLLIAGYPGIINNAIAKLLEKLASQNLS